MKKRTLIILTIIVNITLLLSACSSSNSPSAATTDTTSSGNSQSDQSLSQVNMLLVGTLKLEETDKAVSVEEAADLLTLWQAYRSLSTSQTAAEAEVDALLDQIEGSMTSEQVQAIMAMNLTSSDMMALMQSMGGGMIGRSTPDPQGTPSFEFPSGGFEGGVPPSNDFQTGEAGPSFRPNGNNGGRIPPGGGFVIQGGPGGDAGSDAGLGLGGDQSLQGTPDPSMLATAQARFSTQANQVNTMLLNVLISKLETKTAN